jgi:CRP/FNR family transcriptional regulator, cyclic AMP receptor protein
MTAGKVVSSRDFLELLKNLVRNAQLNTGKLQIRKRSWIYHCGDRNTNLYWIESGQVKTVLYTETGKECVLSVHGRDGMFGEMCFAQEERMEAAIAMRDTVVWKIARESMLQALTTPALQRGMVNLLTARLLEQQQTIASLVMHNSEQRLASIILQLARKLGKRSAGDLHLDNRMSHEELSAMVGTTRSRVGYFLKRFREAGLVEISPKSSLIVHEDRMVHFASGDSDAPGRSPREYSL